MDNPENNEQYWQKVVHLLNLAENNLLQAKKILAEKGQLRGEWGENSNSSPKIIKGIFTGEEMATSEGKKYPVPPNYASKSKLVAGDILKLSIRADGSFVYKQIKPAARRKSIGIINKAGDNYLVQSEGKNYCILPASVTYFQAKEGDRVTIILPKNKESIWAALENVIEEKRDKE